MGPRYTVIIPVARFNPAEPVLASLREHVPFSGPAQIIVAEGRHPARQRNAALRCAEGEIVVFLDNDCRVGSRFWIALDAAFDRAGVEIVGGPALLDGPGGAGEEIFHALLAHPLVTGPVAARYAARGSFRETDQTELILCNLAARHALFDRVGSLSTELYPNEENEWLDRAQAAGVAIHYDPALQVFRPQRATGWQVLTMLVRYGIGRTWQLRISGWRLTPHQALPLLVAAPFLLAAYFGKIGWFLLALLWLIGAVAVAATCSQKLGWFKRVAAGLVAPLVPISYALGQVLGFLTLLFPWKAGSLPIVLYDERGRRLG
jgi:hypothetical protein